MPNSKLYILTELSTNGVTLMLRHKGGQDERGEIFIGKFGYALTMLPGENNAHN